MNVDRLLPVLTYTTIIAVGVLIFCVGVLWTFPLHFLDWSAVSFLAAAIGLVSSVSEIVLCRRAARTHPMAAVQ